MAALTERFEYEVVGDTRLYSNVALDNDVYYKGAMIVCDKADGKYKVPSDTVDLVPVGVYTGNDDDVDLAYLTIPSGVTKKIQVERGRIWIPKSGAAQADVGQFHYLADDGSVTLTKSVKTWSVYCEGWKAGYLELNFDRLRNS